MRDDRWQVLSDWLSGWIEADPQARVRLRDEFAATHPDLIGEADRMSASVGFMTGFLETPALVLAARELAVDAPVLPAGATVGPYRVVQLLARGGMGDVYRATDSRLGRDVALKVLAPGRTADPHRVDRFLMEARVTASLDHPNIVRLYDVGRVGEQAYLVAELLDGETLRARILRGPIGPDEVRRIALDVARGLAAAHEAGLVHRDLKPENIFLTRAGETKLLDFGIAKLTQDENVPDGASTLTGVVLGTAGYLAPEQIRGDGVDGRADLFAFGAVLFEMVSGARAFVRDQIVDTLHAILHDPPALALETRPGVPLSLATIVGRLLAKAPGERFQSAAELISALERADVGRTRSWPARLASQVRASLKRPIWKTAAAAAVVAVALLGYSLTRPRLYRVLVIAPFDNTGDRTSDSVAQDLSDELAALLRTVDRLEVHPRPASTRAGDPPAPTTGASPPGPTAHVRGTVQVGKDRLLISWQLLDGGNGHLLKNQEYDAPWAERGAIQARMAADIALAAGFQTTVERFQAQDLYMRGRQSWRTRTREGVEDAVGYYKQAKERDPAFALAYAGLAEAYVNQTNFGYREMVSGLALALASANKALALDPDLAEAHTARGFVQASHLNFAEAEGEFKRALDLKPRYVWAHHYYTLMLMMMGRTTEALVQNEAALSLDPESLAVQATKGIIFAQDRRWAEAIRQLKKAPEFAPANFFLGALHAAEGAFEEAGQALGAAYEKAPDFPGVAGGLAYVLAHTGKTAASKAAIENLGIHAKDHRSLANLAFALGALGRLDEAFKLLDGVIWDLPTVIELRVDPLLEEMRRDPRYGKLLATIIK